MAEPLKNSFGADVPVRIADMIASVFAEFDRDRFLGLALDGYDELELTPRARQISEALSAVLPDDRERAVRFIISALGTNTEKPLTGMDSFLYLPFVFFVADHGLECYETSMQAQFELTKRFTAEFSIRAYIQRYPQKTLTRLAKWARDPNVHVRRLVSEGTRPRLPWAPRLRIFQTDPSPVLQLLELLKDDPEEYVRRSVANNLNDIAKDHPSLVIDTTRRWMEGADVNRKRLIKHALRSLIKSGDVGALEVLGFSQQSTVTIQNVTCTPDVVNIGAKSRIEVTLTNTSDKLARTLIDLRVHFVKANGSTRPKVFKGAELELTGGQRATVRKTISFVQHTTRKHYPGTHLVDVLVNGAVYPGSSLELV